MAAWRELTQDEMLALREYALNHGRNWRQAMRKDWEAARLTGLLHALRNTHGPRWLTRFAFPAEIAVALDTKRNWQVTRFCCTSGLCVTCHQSGQPVSLGTKRRTRVVQADKLTQKTAKLMEANWSAYGATAERMSVLESA